MKFSPLVCLAFAGLFAPPAFANSTPFAYSVDLFYSGQRPIYDDFEDGTIGAQWTAFGTVDEAGHTATFSNPGAPGFLAPFPVDSDTSGIQGFATAIDGAGGFFVDSIWLPAVPDPGTSYSMALGSVDGSGNTHQVALSVTNTDPTVAGMLGSNPGLNVDLIQQIRNPAYTIISWQVTSYPFDASEVIDGVILTLQFDDVLNQINPYYSLDGGVTTYLLDSVPWSFASGSFALVSSATAPIPEPGTALLLELGLVALCASRRVG
jgi:hypothetical protein